MTNTRSHGLFARDRVRIGKGQVSWTIIFASEDYVIVQREVPSLRHRTGFAIYKRYFHGPEAIATLKLVSR